MDKKLEEQLNSTHPQERAQAIRALAVSGNSENLVLLKRIVENDPDPRIRDYAKKAARHLYRSLQISSQDQSDRTSSESRGSDDNNEEPASENIEEEISPAAINSAGRMIQRSFSLHMIGQTEKAIKLFIKALKLNPALNEDQFASNLAVDLTGLEENQAFNILRDPQMYQHLLGSIQEKTKKPTRRTSPVKLILLIVSLVALVMVSLRFIRSGMFDRYRVLIAQQLGGLNEQRVGNSRYQLMKPLGSQPADGWPVVVALHGLGGQGSDMLPIASDFTRAGIAFIAPSFGDYPPYPGLGPLDPMRVILEDASTQIPIDQEKVVFLGFSQGGTFAYRFSLYHPEWVSGVVTAGAPDLDDGTPVENIPYIFTWGELDGLQDFVLPESVYPLINQGFNVRYEIIPGAGHEVTMEAVEAAIAIIKP